ncbi:MAG TPA: primosomal protein N' [Longimicrobiales bacterium]|nr:primosomal protein N' [Longimicrobiales bacterium]
MLVDVALPIPLPRTFAYRAAAPIAPGTRVRVPFSGRKLVGWVVGQAQPPRELKKLRDVEKVLDTEPSVPADLLELCRWVSGYYVTPLGMVIRSALPAALSDIGRTQSPERTRRVLRTSELPSLTMRDELFRRSPRQRECYEAVEAMGGSADVAHLRETLGFSSGVISALVEKGVAMIGDEREHRDPFADLDPGTPARHTHTAAQAAALAAMVTASRSVRALQAAQSSSSSPPLPFLLHGVTGSGKTLVYIELLREVVERQGRGAIVLVPEIALTPQTVARFRAEFGDVVAVLHSALSDGERYDAWRALRDGERRIAIGARSAIFAPVRDLGAIIVDEEHEASYKQSEAPRYHARELAVVRAGLAGAACVLGSATPALESWHNAQRGKYTLLSLPERVEGRPLPPVEVIDLRRERQLEDDSPMPRAGPIILADALVDAINERLLRREQCILLLNRRGYATFVQCRACGTVWQCPECNVSLTYHRGRRRVVCHYCMHDEAPPDRCTACGSEDVSFRGVGTEQVERTVAETFPRARIARMDVDTTSAKWAHHEILERVGSGEIDILLGTQMIAKGLDFANVTLVGVVNADVAMNLPDFRASERTFQLLTQVAGRAGRGPKGGQVIIQTSLPQHYAIRCAVTHDFTAFAARELAEREAPAYPPHTRLANIVISGLDEDAVVDAVQHCAHWVEDLMSQHRLGAAAVLTGPAPCPIDRIRARWRWHFLLRSPSANILGNLCRMLHTKYDLKPGKAELRIVIDRDPVSLL